MKSEIYKIQTLLDAYKSGSLGDNTMPEDTFPKFKNLEQRRIYYTLPMALNYQRNSFTLWESAKKTFEDIETSRVFDLQFSSSCSEEELRRLLTKYKLALQPNKHINTWQRISKVIHTNWGSLEKFFEDFDLDFLKIRQAVQKDYKKEFPYLSGPKIFNYWMYTMSTYGKVELKNRSYIEIAPDTHVIKGSVKLGIISSEEAKSLSRDEISKIWRDVLNESGIDPIDVHSPLWFWSRGGFVFEI